MSRIVASLRWRAHLVAKINLDAEDDRLLKQRPVEAAAPYQIEQRPLALDGVTPFSRVEYRPTADQIMLEARSNSGRVQLIQHVLPVAPVLEVLEIAVKSVAGLGVALAHA